MSTNEIFNQMLSAYDFTKDSFLEKLNERLATADINQVKADVLPFIRNPKEMGIWSNDYFLQLAQMIRFE